MNSSFLSVYFADANNPLDHQKMSEAIALEAPSFLPHAYFRYASETPLRGRDYVSGGYPSREIGVAQFFSFGDPSAGAAARVLSTLC